MKTKRDKYDITFSNLIRERDDYTCQRCGKPCRDGAARLDCSHFFSRRHQATRYDPDNAAAHCFTCHQHLGENPILFQSWIRTYLGEVRYSELVARHRTIKKWIKGEKDEMRAHYQSELKHLEQARSEGATGPLVVVGWES